MCVAQSWRLNLFADDEFHRLRALRHGHPGRIESRDPLRATGGHWWLSLRRFANRERLGADAPCGDLRHRHELGLLNHSRSGTRDALFQSPSE